MIIKSKNVHNIFPESGIIFIHIPKTGGTSINNFLLDLRNDDVSIEDKKKYYYYEELKRKKISSKHGKARDYQKIIDNNLWDKSFKIASVRNPWDLMVSSYYWGLQEGFKFHRCRHMYNDVSNMNFNEFLNSPYGTYMINDAVGNIEDWVYDENGNNILNGLLRLEYFEEDFKNLINKSKIKLTGIGNLPKLNTTNHNNYQEFYNSDTKNLIEKRFKFLIENYGYKF